MRAILNTEKTDKNYFGFYYKILEKDFYLENILNSTSDYIAILNDKKQIIFCSEKFKNLFGNENIIDKNFIQLMNKISDFPQDFFLEKHYFIKIKNENKIFHADIYKYTADKAFDKKYIIIFKDITYNNETELQKNIFINTIMHDIKTPVRANIAALKLLLNSNCEYLLPKQRLIIEEILNSNKILFSMLDTLLLKFQYENNCQLTKQIVNLNQLITQIINEFQFLIKEKNITLKTIFENENVFILADEKKLKTAIFNIISNAIKFNKDKGFIEIHLKTENNTTIIEITNSGIGINENKINYIFDKYANIGNSYRKPGSGLSLYISKKIIETHNGMIKVNSIPNKITTFSVLLPQNKDNFCV